MINEENTQVEKRRIFARKTRIELVKHEDAQQFVEIHHRQGTIRDQFFKTISLGLFLKDELIGVGQFGSPRTARTKREYSVELLRLAFLQNVQVIGGASKLIKHFIKIYKPADLFTYQSMQGSQSDVYFYAGLKLVRSNKTKTYLVAPNKTLATAEKFEAFSMNYVSSLGPDKLIGTNIGEVYDGERRKTNSELFLDLGWHEEITIGDRLFEWVDPNRTYYTYKITASDSEKYYYGMSHVKKKNATLEDCKSNDYFGSGGTKLQNWRNKHLELVEKTILRIFTKRMHAYTHEIELIGNSYKTDVNCLNLKPGGQDGGLNVQRSITSKNLKKCEIHGETKHQNNSCCKCVAATRYKLANCEVHGMTNHTKRGCVKCYSKDNVSQQICLDHGLTSFINNNCSMCSVSNRVKIKNCPVHGDSKFLGNKCYNCMGREDIFKSGNCEIHGLVKLKNGNCAKCLSAKGFYEDDCEIHGKTTFRSLKGCVKCINSSTIKTLNCEIHGVVKTQSNKCSKCEGNKLISNQHCEIHGLTSHKKNACLKCRSDKSKSLKDCLTHGISLHQGLSCFKCSANKLELKLF